jgi:hypothetical protein
MSKIPDRFHWVFWDVDPRKLDPKVGADYILPRILEFGGIAEVRWAIETYGMEGIHRFLRDVGHPELSRRTLAFWRAALHAEKEPWASPPSWRQNSSAHWIA